MVVQKTVEEWGKEKKDSSILDCSASEDEVEEITVDSEQKKGNEWEHAYKISFCSKPLNYIDQSWEDFIISSYNS